MAWRARQESNVSGAKLVAADRQGNAWVVSVVHPELDSLTSQQLGAELQELVDQVASDPVVVDLSRVAFLQSIALGALITFRNRLKDRGTRVALAGPIPRIRRALAITRLDAIFNVYQDVPQALEALQQR